MSLAMICGLIIIAIVIIAMLYLKIKLLSFNSKMNRMNDSIGERMEQYRISGLDKKYNSLTDEELRIEYKKLLSKGEVTFEEEVEDGVTCNLLESEMTAKDIEFQDIIDELFGEDK